MAGNLLSHRVRTMKLSPESRFPSETPSQMLKEWKRERDRNVRLECDLRRRDPDAAVVGSVDGDKQ